MDISKEITAAIDANLPAAVGDVLRKRLEQADQDAKDLAKEKAGNVRYMEQVKALNAEITELKSRVSTGGELYARETAVSKREHAADIFELNARLVSEKMVSTGYFQFLTALVKNPVLKETILRNGSVPIPTGGGGYNSATSSESSTTERTTE